MTLTADTYGEDFLENGELDLFEEDPDHPCNLVMMMMMMVMMVVMVVVVVVVMMTMIVMIVMMTMKVMIVMMVMMVMVVVVTMVINLRSMGYQPLLGFPPPHLDVIWPFL